MTLRNLITEYILFSFTEEELLRQFHVSEAELEDISDVDLLEIYDQTILFPIKD